MKRLLSGIACLGFVLSIASSSQEPVRQVTWRFDETGLLGGHATKVLGHPKLIETPMGKAIAFNGVDDALLVDVHPLAGAETWTWEMIWCLTGVWEGLGMLWCSRAGGTARIVQFPGR